MLPAEKRTSRFFKLFAGQGTKSGLGNPHGTPAVHVDEFADENSARPPIVAFFTLKLRAVCTVLFGGRLGACRWIHAARIMGIFKRRCDRIVLGKFRQILCSSIRSRMNQTTGCGTCR